MYSYEIEQLMQLKNYLISIKDYCEIVATSPQIDHILYNQDHFEIYTNDYYKFKFKIKEIKKD